MNLSLLAALGGLTILHGLAPLLLGIYLAALASSRGRSLAWGLLGPLFYGLTALLVWSLSGADSATMGILGGALGALPAYVVVYALEAQKAAVPAEATSEGPLAPRQRRQRLSLAVPCRSPCQSPCQRIGTP